MNIFERLNTYIETVEDAVVTLATTLIPWLTPLLPAWFTYYHLLTIPGMTPFIAGTTGIAVELFGLSAISTVFSLMRHNKEYKAEKRKMVLALPVGAYMFYIFVVLTVNVLMELPLIPMYHKYVQIASIALLTLMSTPAFVITVSRQQQREIEKDAEKGKNTKVSESFSDSKNDPKNRLDWRNLTFEQRKVVYESNSKQVQELFKVSPRTSTNWKNNATQEFGKHT